MKGKVAAIALCLAAGALLVPATGFVTSAEAGRCVTKRGKGWAWTQDIWPIQTDTFRNERYKCKKDGDGYTCLSWIDVCKS
jgi:hypothetical protein